MTIAVEEESRMCPTILDVVGIGARLYQKRVRWDRIGYEMGPNGDRMGSDVGWDRMGIGWDRTGSDVGWNRMGIGRDRM